MTPIVVALAMLMNGPGPSVDASFYTSPTSNIPVQGCAPWQIASTGPSMIPPDPRQPGNGCHPPLPDKRKPK